MKKTALSGTLAYTLFTLESNPSQRRFAFIIGAIIALASLASLPFAHIRVPNNNAFLSAICSSVICFEFSTVFVLYSQFKVSRSPSILILAGGYFYSACMTILYLFSFPGILPPNGGSSNVRGQKASSVSTPHPPQAAQAAPRSRLQQNGR
ncbi:hypothetical protein [Paenibacillus lignilyticus]|uniref:Membrane-associated sensor domain-containing protein n=1 Tax=Paenibacillus lignilyticus TaxID=1172615 RepID=A0ABS5CGM8_9BACL|nr:hypothetical protein [Paenibacillus lignilyticus]MBP3964989.1 hypothetical protein [Paenibacillus lignilyticus]